MLPGSLRDGRTYRLFTVLDEFYREELTIDINFPLPTDEAISALDQVIEWCAEPSVLY